jgi:hypothetical protein
LTATVTRSSGRGTPTGDVVFSVGTKTLAVVALNTSGIASFTAATGSVPAGTYPIVATYVGDAGDNGAQSNTVAVAVVAGYGY